MIDQIMELITQEARRRQGENLAYNLVTVLQEIITRVEQAIDHVISNKVNEISTTIQKSSNENHDEDKIKHP